MADKKFLMFSLEDKETKKIANIVGNDSCRKILDYLSAQEATASELSEKLSIPLPTVTYNMQLLVDAGLVSADEFHYSKKGKEVLHYKLANKYIIITPKAVSGIKDKLRKILPLTFISAGAAGFVQLVHQYITQGKGAAVASGTELATMMYDESQEAAARSVADTSMMKAQPLAMETMQAPSAIVIEYFPLDIAFWFFAGALFGLVVYVVISMINKEP